MQTIGVASGVVNHDADAPRGIWDRPGFLVRRLHQLHVAVWLSQVADGQVTPIQYGVLSILAMRPGVDQFTLGEELGLDRANVTGILSRLEARGWVRRRTDAANRRRRLCSLTAEGERFLRAHDAEMQASQRLLLQPLSAAERRTFMDLLERLVRANNDLGRTALAPGGRSFGEVGAAPGPEAARTPATKRPAGAAPRQAAKPAAGRGAKKVAAKAAKPTARAPAPRARTRAA